MNSPTNILDTTDFNAFAKQMYKLKPRSVDGADNLMYFFYFNQLSKIVLGLFKFENCPDTWDMDYFKEVLLFEGKILVTDTSAGLLPLRCSTHGINVFNRPNKFIVHNPVLGELDGNLGEDGLLIYLNYFMHFYENATDLVSKYSSLFADLDGSLNSTIINSRVAHIFTAENNAQLKTMQKLYDEISQGRPAVFLRDVGADTTHVLFNNVKNTYIGTELLDTKRTLMCEFLTQLGIDNANTSKRERLNTDEVNSNNVELKSYVEVWFENLKKCVKLVNEKYDLNISVSKNYEKAVAVSEKVVENNAQSD